MILKHRGKLQSHYALVARRVFGDLRLSESGLRVYGILRSHSEGWVTSYARLCDETNLSRRSVIRGLKELEEFGYLSRRSDSTREGSQKSVTCYVESEPKILSDSATDDTGCNDEAGASCDTGGVPAVTPPGVPAVTPLTRKVQDNLYKITPYSPPEGDGDGSTGEVVPVKKKPGRNDYSQEFENFWAVYPRSVDKGRAFKAWERALKATTLDHVMTQAAAYAELCRLRKTETRFIRHPTTFINNVEDADYYSELIDERQAAGNGYSQSSNPFDDIRSNRAANSGIVDGEVTSTQWI